MARFAFQRLEVYGVAKAIAQLTIDNRRRWAELPGGVAERLSRATLALVAEIAAGAAAVMSGALLTARMMAAATAPARATSATVSSVMPPMATTGMGAKAQMRASCSRPTTGSGLRFDEVGKQGPKPM